MATNDKPEEFTGWRSILWPIHNSELKKFLPMALMMMCILFNYSILRGMKDSLVVTTMGASAIPTLKLWFVLPAAVIFMIVYSKLSNAFSKNDVFYIVTSFFLSFFILFALFLYPCREALSLDFGEIKYEFLKRFLKPVAYWPISSLYIMAELWGSAMVSLMFWRFANDVTSLKESKRFYSMFGFVANGALIISGIVLQGGDTGKASNEWEMLPWLIASVCVSCLIIMAIYKWLNDRVLSDPRFYNPDEVKKPKKKVKLSLSESFRYILSSKYLGFIALLIICYGISINLVEVMWKEQANLLYTTKAAFGRFMGNLQISTGIATILFMLVGANILRRCTWFTAAMMTPLMIFITGLIFFGFIIYGKYLEPTIAATCGLTVLQVIVNVGLIQNVLSKGVKYSLFDSTKEMSYIPLDDELKSKGKAAVDVIGGRAGKSGGAAIQFLLFNVFFVGTSSLSELAPQIAYLFVMILGLWFYAVRGLNKEFLKITSK